MTLEGSLEVIAVGPYESATIRSASPGSWSRGGNSPLPNKQDY